MIHRSDLDTHAESVLGSTLHVPRGTPHAFRDAAPDTRLDQDLPKVLALPAAANGGPPDPAALARARAEHDAFAA